jgi:hypothetical protein
MAEIKLNTVYRVDIIESERGWGSKIDEVKYFDTEQSAKDFCTEFNKGNPPDHVPDWYMVAQYIGKVR